MKKHRIIPIVAANGAALLSACEDVPATPAAETLEVRVPQAVIVGELKQRNYGALSRGDTIIIHPRSKRLGEPFTLYYLHVPSEGGQSTLWAERHARDPGSTLPDDSLLASDDVPSSPGKRIHTAEASEQIRTDLQTIRGIAEGTP